VAINFIAAGSTSSSARPGSSRAGARRRCNRASASRPSPARRRCHPRRADHRPIYAELLSGHSILVYLAFLMVPFTWWVLYRTRFGLACAPSAKTRRRRHRRHLGRLAALPRA
jgi:ABC-type uncharacterized transport system permease subunit